MTADPIHDSLVEELPRLRKFAHFLAGNPQSGDDLFQDALERAIQSIDQARGGTSLRAWLFAIARNRHVDLVRRSQRRPDDVSLEQSGSDVVPVSLRQTDGFLQDLDRAFSALNSELREVMWLVAVEGFTYDETASVTEVPVGTVRSRVFRARRALKDELGEYWSGGRPEDDANAGA